jgi:hypothetical protein
MHQRTWVTAGADHLVNVVGRVAVLLWLRTSDLSDRHLPRPDSPDLRPEPGHDADRLLLLGNGVTVGYGVLSHDLSLAGHLARQLTRATGRPTHVHVEGDSAMTARTALVVAGSVDLERLDGIVVTVGINEVLALSSIRRWERDIAQFVDYVLSPAVPGLETFMVAIPRLRSVADTPRFIRWLTERHTARLNAVLRAACEAHDRFTFVPFDPVRSPQGEAYRSTDVYREWAELIVEPIARRLSRQRPRVGETGT